MGRPGPKKVHRYSVEFKLTAVKLSSMPGVQVQTVADALDIHPFMLSRWRKEARDGLLKGRAGRGVVEGGAPGGDQAVADARARARDAPRGACTPKKSHPVLFRTKREIFSFIDRERGGVPLRRMCALYGVTRVGYYAWQHRGESARRRQDRGLLSMIRTLFETSRRRAHGIVLSLDEERRGPRTALRRACRARAATPRLHSLLQPCAPALRDRLLFTRRL